MELDNFFGFISIYTENDSYQISYGIIPERRQEYLGALLLQEFSEKCTKSIQK